MQTSQVSNPANVVANPASGSKQSDADNASAPFDQVLSREMADRATTRETGKTKDGSDAAAATKQPVKNSAGQTEAKRAEGNKKDDAADEAVNSAIPAAEDILALVANLAQINQPMDTSDAAGNAGTAEIDSALATVTIGADQPVASPLVAAQTAITPAAQGTSELAESTLTPAHTKGIAQVKFAATATAAADATGIERQSPEQLTSAGTADAPAVTATADLASKGTSLPSSTPAIPVAISSDFSAAMQQSLSATASALQPAAAQAAQQSPTLATDKLTPQVGSPAWDQALGQKVVWMVAGEQQSASLTLNPPDLGPLQVVLNVSNSQANATFIAAQPEVRQALEAALPKLREMLGEAGIQLGQANVNSGSSNQQNSAEQQASHGSRQFTQTDSRAEATVRVSRVPIPSSGQGLVDTFA